MCINERNIQEKSKPFSAVLKNPNHICSSINIAAFAKITGCSKIILKVMRTSKNFKVMQVVHRMTIDKLVIFSFLGGSNRLKSVVDI